MRCCHLKCCETITCTSSKCTSYTAVSTCQDCGTFRCSNHQNTQSPIQKCTADNCGSILCKKCKKRRCMEETLQCTRCTREMVSEMDTTIKRQRIHIARMSAGLRLIDSVASAQVDYLKNNSSNTTNTNNEEM